MTPDRGNPLKQSFSILPLCTSCQQYYRLIGHLRQKGKIAELALGYGGSVGALKSMGALEMGLTEEELHAGQLLAELQPDDHRLLVGDRPRRQNHDHATHPD